MGGFTKSLALEGAKKGIYINSIAPLAASRLTETVMPKEMLAKMGPEFVVPLAVLLSHEESISNGEIIEAGAGWFQKIRVERAKGAYVSDCTPERLKDSWDAVIDFSKDTQHPTSMAEHPFMTGPPPSAKL